MNYTLRKVHSKLNVTERLQMNCTLMKVHIKLSLMQSSYKTTRYRKSYKTKCYGEITNELHVTESSYKTTLNAKFI